MSSWKHYLVIDLEATCADDGSIPDNEREIIEIGAVLVETAGLTTVEEYQSFVRPVQHPVLSPFCTELTTITQAEVDAAPLFPEVLGQLCQQMGVTEEDLFCSWGDYDRAQFEQDCAYHGAPYPFGENHLNLRVAYSKAKASEYRFTVEEALHHIGLTLQGTYHRGIDDARNIARLLPHIVMP